MKNGLQGGEGNEQHPSDVKTYNLARSISNYLSYLPLSSPTKANFLLSLSTVHQSCSRFAKLGVNSRKGIYLSVYLSLSLLACQPVENRSAKFNSTVILHSSLPSLLSQSEFFTIIHVHARLIDRVITFDYSLLISPPG